MELSSSRRLYLICFFSKTYHALLTLQNIKLLNFPCQLITGEIIVFYDSVLYPSPIVSGRDFVVKQYISTRLVQEQRDALNKFKCKFRSCKTSIAYNPIKL